MHFSLFSFAQTSFKISINSIMYFLSCLIIPACTRMSSNGIPSRILLTTCWKTSGTVAMPKGTLLKQYLPQVGWRLCFSLCILTLSFAGIPSIGMVAKTSWRFVRWFLSVVPQWVMSPDRNSCLILESRCRSLSCLSVWLPPLSVCLSVWLQNGVGSAMFSILLHLCKFLLNFFHQCKWDFPGRFVFQALSRIMDICIIFRLLYASNALKYVLIAF